VSKLYYSIFCLGLISLLTACGGDDEEPVMVATHHRYNGIGFDNQCAPQIAHEWNRLIASRCNDVCGRREARACIRGAEEFRHRFPRVMCNIAVADTEFRPDGWNNQQAYFTINDFVINSIFQQHGWASTGPNVKVGPGPRCRRNDWRDEDGIPGNGPGFPGGH
jgi:hypothetical protein